MDFDRSEQTSTTYNPNGQVVRSQQQTRSKSSRSSGTNKTVSVSNNLPGATSSKAGPKRLDTQSKSTQTTNYEISQDVKHIVHATPQITRISVAVMLDDVKTTNPKGKVIWTPRSPAQVAQIRKLVETAIGYDKSRGDVVDVQSLQFAPNELPVSAKRSLIGRFLSSGLLIPLLRLLVTAGIGIAALLVVFRPMVRRIITPPENATAEPALLAEQNGAIAGPATTEETNPVKVIADLIDRHPEASVAILRDWLGQEGAR
jgi:flagellar M-ring protein FliF